MIAARFGWSLPRSILHPCTSQKTSGHSWKRPCSATKPDRPRLRARILATQKAEARLACSVINRMTQLGMPISQRVRSESKPEPRFIPHLDLCTNARGCCFHRQQEGNKLSSSAVDELLARSFVVTVGRRSKIKPSMHVTSPKSEFFIRARLGLA